MVSATAVQRRPRAWRKLTAGLDLPPPSQCDGITSLGLRDFDGTRKERLWKYLLFLWQLLFPVLCSGFLLAAIILGLERERWPLTPTTIGSIEVDQDLQLIILGVVNKSLDVVVQIVLEHMGLVCNTLWMIQPGIGATMQDTLIKNEMTKPWAAIRAYARRRRAVGLSTWGTIVRLILTLAVSVSVMLLGAGLNTVGWPKKRWYPNHGPAMNLTEHPSQDLTILTPVMTLDRVDWAADMRAGLALVGGVPQLDEDGEPVLTGGAADEIAGAIAASTAFFALTRVPGTYDRVPVDWLSVWDTPAYITGIQTRVNDTTVQSISVQSQRIYDLFEWQKKEGKPFAKTATGFHGIVQMAVPQLTTTCSDSVANGPPDNGIEVRQPDAQSTSFAVHIGSSNGLKFAGIACTLTLSQVLVPVETWIVDMQSSPWVAINNITAPVVPQLLPVSTASSDALITSRLAAHFNSMLPMLNGQVPSFGIVPHLVMTARTLQTRHPSFSSDAAALAPVVATLAQQQLSTAAWTIRTHDDVLISSAPVHWQLYGSGPRMTWEWIAIVVLFIVFFAMASDILLLIVYRIQPGSWLELGGMLRVAHTTPRLLDFVKNARTTTISNGRERVIKRGDDSTRFTVKSDEFDQWPILVQTQSTSQMTSSSQLTSMLPTNSTPTAGIPAVSPNFTSSSLGTSTPVTSSVPPGDAATVPTAATASSTNTTLQVPNALTASRSVTPGSTPGSRSPSPATSTTALLSPSSARRA